MLASEGLITVLGLCIDVSVLVMQSGTTVPTKNRNNRPRPKEAVIS